MYTGTYYMRGTLWKSERCISRYVCQRDCKHVCTRIQTHPYTYQQYLKSPTQILKKSYTTPPTPYHPRSPIIEETVSPMPLKLPTNLTLCEKSSGDAISRMDSYITYRKKIPCHLLYIESVVNGGTYSPEN